MLVLVVDDDRAVREALERALQLHGYEVALASDGDSALAAVEARTPDALVLDVMMPGRSGLDALRELRRESALPVLMLTALGEDIDRILGLELGADDYIPKPCNPRELAARLRAVLRRVRGEGNDALTDLANGPIRVRAASRSVTMDGRPLTLTATEFDLLVLLLREVGRVVTKERISQAVLGRPLGPFDRSIDVHVSNLRRKLGDAADGGSPITTIHRGGYLLRQLDDPA
jgi:DNA-binding response OmpR family regulator